MRCCCRAVSTLQGEEKFFCNECGTYQEAQQRTRLSVLPPVLLVHFKRFKTTTHMDRCVSALSLHQRPIDAL